MANHENILKPTIDMYGVKSSRLKFFSNCTIAIKNIPLLQYDDKKLEDTASTPHDITHAPESIRYGIMSRPRVNDVVKKQDDFLYRDKPDSYELDDSFINMTIRGR